MKTTYKFILAALAATVTLASCTKDPVPGKSDSDSAVTYRTITVSFDSPTKAKLDGTKPRFQQGDMILLSDGTALDTCEVGVDVNGGAASINTKLTGELTAVYPMSAVSNTDPKEITSALLIPIRQSGKFSDANICTANCNSNAITTMEFRNIYPILRFYVDSTIAVKSITIQSQGNSIANENGLDYSELGTIIVDAGESGRLDKVTEERVCYVAVCNNVNAGDLTFTSVTETQGMVIRKSPSKVNLGSGAIYNAFIPYSVQVGNQKWGYCNVGAFYPEDPGCYFAWGENEGYKWYAKMGQNGQFQDNHCFDWKNYQYNSDHDGEFTEQECEDFITKICPEGKLALQNDAAYANWGEGWRMPTNEEMEVMIKTVGDNLKPDSTGVVFGGCLKIPYSGYGEDSIVKYGKLEAGNNWSNPAFGCFWTSENNKNEIGKSLYFSFSYEINSINLTDITFKQNLAPAIYSHDYSNGLPVRPFFDETMSGGDAVSLKLSAYTDGKTL